MRKRADSGCYTTHHSPGDGTGLDHRSFKGKRPQDILDGEAVGGGDYKGYSPPDTHEDTGRTTYPRRSR